VNSPYISQFSISDLEGFSGVKAHTIRVWERRYNLLEPDRTGSNYRLYSLDELRTILNVAFLTAHGIKIGKVAAMRPEERSSLVREISERHADHGDTLNSLKVAMLSFDESLFRSASEHYREREGFNALVEGVYVPLLEHIGHLWHSGAICPSQEHFVSNLIRQRIVAETEALPLPAEGAALRVLYLPDQEIHELGLLYTNYLLRSFGDRTIYLGQSVPTDDLHQITELFSGPITFISFITSFPPADGLQRYMDGLRAQIPDERHQFWFTGSQVNRAPGLKAPEGFRVFPHIRYLIEAFAPQPH
jgi:DNA-binding transcriptional MerR regulator